MREFLLQPAHDLQDSLLTGRLDDPNPQWLRIASTWLGLRQKGVQMRVVTLDFTNFDQRSMHINTGIGLISDSPPLTRQVAMGFEAMVQAVKRCMPVCRPDGVGGLPRLRWCTPEGSQAGEYHTEPSHGNWPRVHARPLSLMPLEKEL